MAATGELATPRAEARHAACAAGAGRDAARAENVAALEEIAAISAQLAEARQTHAAVQAELTAERQAHAATQARLEAGRGELDATGRQLAELRTQFSTELDRAREQVTLVQERAEASERRTLRELVVAAAALADRLAAAEQAQCKSVNDLDTVQADLAAAQRRTERAEAEAALVRQLLAELRVAPKRDGGARRKAGGSAPSNKPGDKPGKTGRNQRALTVSLTPEDGSDSSNRNDDSQQ